MIEDHVSTHPERYALTNELHARPFTPMKAPGRVVSLSFMPNVDPSDRDHEADLAHLRELIDRHGGTHPAPGSNHYFADFDRFRLKWERHTEFVSYTLYEAGRGERAFDASLANQFPDQWLASAPGRLFAAVQIELFHVGSRAEAVNMIDGPLRGHFARESLAISRVQDDHALAMGDFRIHENGFTRFALVVYDALGEARKGRTVQRLIEIENYRTLAMMALPVARATSGKLAMIDARLNRLVQAVAGEADDDAPSEAEILQDLTSLSAEIEALTAATAFRFGAARAYDALVAQRIEMLREERLEGRQLFREFMNRRYDPAMRTCISVADRLSEMAERTSRIADLLRTRVDVSLEAQNQQLLRSMDQRAALQLRLQETVEGLSVVAISYYAVSLAATVLAPPANALGIDKTWLSAIIAVPIVALVWFFVQRIRRRIEARQPGVDP